MDISEYYIDLLEQFRNVREAEHEFRRHIEDDPALRRDYEQWCVDNDFSPRDGLRIFGQQYIEEREERWQSLTDFDEQ